MGLFRFPGLYKIHRKRISEESNTVVACNGYANIRNSNGFIEVGVTDIHVHLGDVNLRTGNLRFAGDVILLGTVSQNAMVDAKGWVTIKGNVNETIVSAEKGVLIARSCRGIKDLGRPILLLCWPSAGITGTTGKTTEFSITGSPA